MIKRIGCSFIYFIIWVLVCSIVNKLLGSSEWLYNSMLTGIGAFFGTFIGYGWGKNDKD